MVSRHHVELIQEMIDDALRPILQYINLEPSLQTPFTIPSHLNKIQAALSSLGILEPALPLELWWSMALRLQNNRDILEAMGERLKHMESTVVAPVGVESEDTGGRPRLALDLDDRT